MRRRLVVTVVTAVAVLATACSGGGHSHSSASGSSNLPSTSGPLPGARCGAWTLSTLPPIGGFLLGVTALSATDAWAAGRDGAGKMVILHWGGTSWTEVWKGRAGALYSVKALSPNDVWATGRDGQGATAVHWDGRAWTVLAPRLPQLVGQSLLIESALRSGSDVWAAGLFVNQDQAFVVHWDGTSWSLDTGLTLAQTALRSISVAPSGTLWAVGETVVGTTHHPLIQKATAGGPWTPVPTGIAPTREILLHGVLAVSDQDVWATGYENVRRAGGVVENPIAVHVGPSGVELTPMAAVKQGRPRHLAAFAPNDVVAVGDQLGTAPLVEHWDGTSWQLMTVPTTQRLFGVASSPASHEVWAVGYGPTILHLCR